MVILRVLPRLLRFLPPCTWMVTFISIQVTYLCLWSWPFHQAPQRSSMTSGGWSILCSSEWLRWQSGGSWTTASCAASLNCVLKVWLSYHVTCFEHCFKFFPFPQIFFGNCHVLGPIIKFCFGPRTVMVCSGAVRNTYSWNLVSSGGGRKIKELTKSYNKCYIWEE